MIKSEIIYDELLDYYQHLQNEYNSKKTLIESLLNENLDYKQLSQTKRILELKIAKNEFNGNIEDNLKLQNEYENINRKLLIFNDIIDNYKSFYNLEFKCNFCNDTGFIEGKPCKCFYRNLSKIALKKLGIYEKPLHSFKDDTLSAKFNLSRHFNLFKTYSNKFPNVKINNFIIQGECGTSKTFLAECITSEIINNFNALFISAIDLNNVFNKIYYSTNEEKKLYFDILKTCDFLVIDDLGTEEKYNSNYSSEYLLTLISYRLDNRLPFIITTNLKNNEILNRYGERLFSRLSDQSSTKFINIKCEDIRLFKNNK